MNEKTDARNLGFPGGREDMSSDPEEKSSEKTFGSGELA